MIAEQVGLAVLVLLLLAAIISFPIYVLVRLSSLGRMVSQLRDEMRAQDALRGAAAEEPVPSPGPTPPPAAKIPEPVVVAPSAPAAAAARRAAIDWETVLGANWLSKLGAIALAVAVAFFLKYSFESGWIGKQARVGIGLVAAAVLLGIGQRLLAKERYRAWAQVLMSGGVIIFFLSVYAAYNFYHLVGFTVSFAALALGATAASALAAANNTQAVALLCLLGAFFTPVLIHSGGVGPDDLSRLYLYLAALNTWALVLVGRRRWHSLPVLSFGATWLIFFGSQPGRKLDFVLFETFAALFLLFACYSAVVILSREREPSPRAVKLALAIIICACAAFAVISVQILSESYLAGLPSLVMAGVFLALLLVGMAAALPTLPARDAQVRQGFVFVAAGALTLVVVAAIYAAPSVERKVALPGFIFAVFSYLVFLATTAAIQRREPQGPGAVGLLAANVAVHAMVSFHVLGPVRVWAMPAAPLWLPMAGWVTLLFAGLVGGRAQVRGTYRSALLLAAQAPPVIALLGGLSLAGRFSTAAPWRGPALFLAEFALLSLTWLALHRRAVRALGLRADLLAAFSNAVVFFGLMALSAGAAAFRGLLLLTACALALGAYHALVGLVSREDDPLHRITYLGLGLTFVAMVIPIQLRASYLTIGCAAESAVLIWSGVAVGERRTRLWGLALLAVAGAMALFRDLPPLDEPVRLLHNLRLLAGLAIVAAAGSSARSLARARPLRPPVGAGFHPGPLMRADLEIGPYMPREGGRALSPPEAGAAPGLMMTANVYALVFLSAGVWQHLDAVWRAPGLRNAQQLSLSILWCAYAFALMAVGIWRRARPVRLFALALLFVAIIKVFVLDLRYLEQPYRIISFMGLGLILLVVSLLYTRF